MKELYLVGGTMGVGKTTVCRIMKTLLDNSVLLDGDWCWDMHPFTVTEETKRMVMGNIRFLLNSFIGCTAFENVIFCWVMHEQGILDEILGGLDLSRCRVHAISLVCGEEALIRRLEKDAAAGLRERDAVKRSVVRLPLYEKLNTRKVDVSTMSAEQAAEYIIKNC